jgi:hypothetical protein
VVLMFANSTSTTLCFQWMQFLPFWPSTIRTHLVTSLVTPTRPGSRGRICLNYDG